MEQLKIAWEWAREFNDEGLHIVLLILALIYIAWKEEERIHRYLILGYTVVFFFFYFLPPFVWIADKLLGELVYWRMLWLLPTSIFIAYAGVKIWDRTSGRLKKAVLFVAFVILIGAMGQNVYWKDGSYRSRKNWEKLPESPVAICKLINEHRTSKEEHAMVAAPEDMVVSIIQYDGSIQQVYGRKGNALSSYVKKNITAESLNYERFCEELRAVDCNYVVLPFSDGRAENMAYYGFEVIGTVGSYVVYKDVWWGSKS